jgi:hypothetical protein
VLRRLASRAVGSDVLVTISYKSPSGLRVPFGMKMPFTRFEIHTISPQGAVGYLIVNFSCLASDFKGG